MIQNLKNSMKRSKYLRLLLVVPMVVLFLYCSVTLVNQSADISRMQKQKQTLTAQLASVQQENARLEEVVGADNKDDYIEQKAREKGYVKGDEIVFYDISGTEYTEQIQGGSNQVSTFCCALFLLQKGGQAYERDQSRSGHRGGAAAVHHSQ